MSKIYYRERLSAKYSSVPAVVFTLQRADVQFVWWAEKYHWLHSQKNNLEKENLNFMIYISAVSIFHLPTHNFYCKFCNAWSNARITHAIMQWELIFVYTVNCWHQFVSLPFESSSQKKKKRGGRREEEKRYLAQAVK